MAHPLPSSGHDAHLCVHHAGRGWCGMRRRRGGTVDAHRLKDGLVENVEHRVWHATETQLAQRAARAAAVQRIAEHLGGKDEDEVVGTGQRQVPARAAPRAVFFSKSDTRDCLSTCQQAGRVRARPPDTCHQLARPHAPAAAPTRRPYPAASTRRPYSPPLPYRHPHLAQRSRRVVREGIWRRGYSAHPQQLLERRGGEADHRGCDPAARAPGHVRHLRQAKEHQHK